MAFKQLLRGSLGEQKRLIPIPDRPRPRKAEAAEPAPQPPAEAARINVLYLTADAREARFVAGTFNYAHPHLHLDLVGELGDARTRLKEPGRYDALVVGWSVAQDVAVDLIAHAREQRYPIAIVAAGEQSLDAYREAGADRCVQKGGTFLARLPIAITEAVQARPAAVSMPIAGTPLRIAYGGDVDRIAADVGVDTAPPRIEPLAQALRNADVRPAGAPLDVDVFVIDHGAGDGSSASALNDVRARNLDAPVVLLVDPADEAAAHQAFGATVDDYLTKTHGWAARLSLRLGPIVARHQQLRELALLRVKEARLRSMVDRLPACVVRLSHEGVMLATNTTATAVLGAQDAGALVRKPFETLVAPDDREAWNAFLAHVRDGEQRSVEVAVTTLAGANRIVEATGTPVPAEFGRGTSMLLVLRDITDRKRLETSIEASAPVAAAPDGAPRIDRSPAPDRGLLRELEGDLHRLAGQARTALADFGSLLQDVESRHDAAFTRQVEEYARLKAAQLEHWRSYEAFVQRAHHGVFRASFEATLVGSNAAFAGMLGYDSPEALVATAEGVDRLVDADKWRRAVEHWRRAPSTEPLELVWRRTDRGLVTLRLHGRVVPTPSGDDECLEVIAEDVTAQRKLETQLRRARRWEDAARVTCGIAADLLHVLDEAKDAGNGPSDDASAGSDGRLGQPALSKVLALTRQLVAFGRKEARGPSALDVNAVVAGIEPVVRRLLDEDIHLTIDLAPDLGTAHASHPLVEDALVNLAVAARDALPAGGSVAIRTCASDLSGVEAADQGVEPGAYVVVSMTATGWGLDVAPYDRRLLDYTPELDDISRRLTAASRALKQAGGDVKVDGVTGDSLTFKALLPREAAIAAFDGETAVPLEAL